MAKCNVRQQVINRFKKKNWGWSRRQFLRAGGTSVFSATLLTEPLFAKISVNVDTAYSRPLNVAIPDFGTQNSLGASIAKVVREDLKSTALFNPLDPAQFPEPLSVDRKPNFPLWTSINAEGLITVLLNEESDRLVLRLRLWDAVSGVELEGQQLRINKRSWRRLGHAVADIIYSRLTGEKGYFDSQIAYIAESGSKTNRTKQLAIMDQDGANPRLLTINRNLVLSPRFNPKVAQIAFASLENNNSVIRLFDLVQGEDKRVTNPNGFAFAPNFSPDGRWLVYSQLHGSGTNIFLLELTSGRTAQLTATNAIDTSASFSPDGSLIVFESDRAGGQQIWVMNTDGSGARQISTGGGRYSTPSWSPTGEYIAFTKQERGRFSIGVMESNGVNERILTTGFHNEAPSWCPNGRVICYFRDKGEGPQLWRVDVTGRNSRPIETRGFASDPAWSPTLGGV